MPLQKPEYAQLRSWYAPVRDLLMDRLGDARGVHLETTISGIAAVAGCLLLRSTGVRLDGLLPGQAVFVEAVDELGREHFEFLSTVCMAMGVEPRQGWTDPVPPNNQPLKTVPELTRLLEPDYGSLCEQLGVPASLRARLASFTAVALVKESREILPPEVGKAIILTAVVAGAKTVPHPLASSTNFSPQSFA